MLNAGRGEGSCPSVLPLSFCGRRDGGAGDGGAGDGCHTLTCRAGQGRGTAVGLKRISVLLFFASFGQ